MRAVDDVVAVDGVADEVVERVGAAAAAVGAAYAVVVVVGAAAVVVDDGAYAAASVVDDGAEVVVDSSAPYSCLFASQAWDHLFFHVLFLDHGPSYSLLQVPSRFCNMEAQVEVEYGVYPWVLVDPHVSVLWASFPFSSVLHEGEVGEVQGIGTLMGGRNLNHPLTGSNLQLLNHLQISCSWTRDQEASLGDVCCLGECQLEHLLYLHHPQTRTPGHSSS